MADFLVRADCLEDRVLDFVAEQRRADRKKLLPTTRLAEDLGIDGDDASEFFKAFGKEFRVNLDNLNMHWEQHFRPESNPLAIAVTIVACVIAGFVLRLLFRFLFPFSYLSGWAWSVVLIIAVFGLDAWWKRGRVNIPITLADLIESAHAGRWTKSYSTDLLVRARH